MKEAPETGPQGPGIVDSQLWNTYNLVTELIRWEGLAMRYSRLLLIAVILCLGLAYSFSNPAADRPRSKPVKTQAPKQEEKPKQKKNKNNSDQVQYYKKWLDEDVNYIISEEERSVFKSLKNDEERDSFIEQFWTRRNPNSRAGDNSFKEEHYRRIAYANEHFASGIPGWKTDRGRIYIMYGKPDELESHPTGGNYNRPFNEGGGTTTTFPFEKWWYRHLEGVGDDIEIEFVDKSMTGEYRMAMSPDEKDALINVPNAGLTLAEEMGLSEKTDRAYFNPAAANDPNNRQNMFMRAKDSPFSRMEQFFNVQRPPKIKFEDLKSVVSAHVSYNTFPYDYRWDCIKLSADKVLVPITIELSNKDLEFKKELDFNTAKVNVYGSVTSLTGRIMYEWEDDISAEYSDQYFQEGKNKRSEYQKIIGLPPGQRFKLDLVLKDVNSKSIGTQSVGLTIPKYDDAALQSSSIILAQSISAAPMSSDQLQQYVIGDLKILPNVKAEYLPGQNLISYMQVYNMEIDQTTQRPSLEVTFVIRNGDKVLEEIKSSAMNSEQFFYGQRVVLLGKIALNALAPGKYKLEIRVKDNISNRSVSTTTDFKVKEPVQKALVAK
jgi:GWxTD domain-containing protein